MQNHSELVPADFTNELHYKFHSLKKRRDKKTKFVVE